LCRAAGCDIIYHAWRDLTGEPLAAQVGRQREGVLWQYFLRDLLSLTHYARRGESSGRDWAEGLAPWRKYEAVASFADLPASLYYPLYGLRQWRANRRGQDSGP
jgi:hypothetical protein